jgi:hypothetical protein
MTFTKEEQQEMLRKMRVASSAFYNDATRIGCHPFIEFTGLMNEYIALCQLAMELGIDFTKTSVHGGGQPTADAGVPPALSERKTGVHLRRVARPPDGRAKKSLTPTRRPWRT